MFALGMMAGMLVLLIAFALYPEPEDPTTAEFEAIRVFTEEHFVQDIDAEELMVRALHGMLDKLDRYSRYYERSKSERIRREIDGDFLGIGVVFRAPTEDGQIMFPVHDSPALEAGMRVGDTIVEIDGESIEGLDADEIRSRLARNSQRTISLHVVGLDGEMRDLTIEPRVLVDPTVRHAHLLEQAPEIGYLTVRSFSNNTQDEFDKTVKALREAGARALIVDLRWNYGGVLDAAIQMAGRFIDSGVVVSSEGRLHSEIHLADDFESLFAGMPLCILVDKDSASASEVLAGALQDHRVGVVIGEPTFGKGMLQTTRSFPQFGSRAKVTSAYFYSPSHRNFERTSDAGRDHGILPDYLVEIDDAARHAVHIWLGRYDPPLAALEDLARWEDESGESILPRPPADAQLDAAVRLLRGERPPPHQSPRREG